MDTILPAGSRRNSVPSNRLGGMVNKAAQHHSIQSKHASIVVAYLNVVKSYVNSLKYYDKVNITICSAIEHLILTQVGMNKGVQKYGDKDIGAIFKEMKQFNDREVVRPLKRHQITKEIRDKALRYLMFEGETFRRD